MFMCVQCTYNSTVKVTQLTLGKLVGSKGGGRPSGRRGAVGMEEKRRGELGSGLMS